MNGENEAPSSTISASSGRSLLVVFLLALHTALAYDEEVRPYKWDYPVAERVQALADTDSAATPWLQRTRVSAGLHLTARAGLSAVYPLKKIAQATVRSWAFWRRSLQSGYAHVQRQFARTNCIVERKVLGPLKQHALYVLTPLKQHALYVLTQLKQHLLYLLAPAKTLLAPPAICIYRLARLVVRAPAALSRLVSRLVSLCLVRLVLLFLELKALLLRGARGFANSTSRCWVFWKAALARNEGGASSKANQLARSWSYGRLFEERLFHAPPAANKQPPSVGWWSGVPHGDSVTTSAAERNKAELFWAAAAGPKAPAAGP